MEKNGKKAIPKISLSHYLSNAGVASRRRATELVKSGQVTVDGKIIFEPGFKLQGGEEVVCGGLPVLPPAEKIYVMLNKPPGYTCSSQDRHAAKLAVELVKIPGVRLFTVGRLDCASEGLLILTNDGDYADRLTHPRYEICKTYLVTADSPLSATELDAIRNGVTDQGEFLKPERFESLGGNRYQVVLNEGKKREIRRLLAAVGKKTVVLRRVAIGKLRLNELAIGSWRHLSENEIKQSLVPGVHATWRDKTL